MRKVLLFFFSHRLLAILRWDIHFMWIRACNLINGQSSQLSRALATQDRPLFLNLGSGPRGRRDKHWINIDGFKDRNVDFVLDISRSLPFPAATFDGVFSEHVLEHFSLEDGEKIAREVRRILSPAGRFRIIVPDAALVLKRYFDAPEELIAWRGEGGTAMETVNSFFRQRYEHQFLYDWPTMESMLTRAGFAVVQRSAFQQSGCATMALDDPKYVWESLYVEAIAGR